MQTLPRLTKGAAALFASCVVSTSAMASDVVVELDALSIGMGSKMSLDSGANYKNWWTGFQQIHVSNDLTPPTHSPYSTFQAFCIDPTHLASYDWNLYEEKPLASSSFATPLSRRNDIIDLFAHFYGSTVGNASSAAAFQIALWEIANDDKNLATGQVRYRTSDNPGRPPAFNTLLANMIADTGYSASTSWKLTVFEVKDPRVAGQDYIVANPVPEPETYAMFLAGLGLMGAVAKRRRRSA